MAGPTAPAGRPGRRETRPASKKLNKPSVGPSQPRNHGSILKPSRQSCREIRNSSSTRARADGTCCCFRTESHCLTEYAHYPSEDFMTTRKKYVAIAAASGLLLIYLSFYCIRETEFALVTQFGRPVRTVLDAGPHVKWPFQ